VCAQLQNKHDTKAQELFAVLESPPSQLHTRPLPTPARACMAACMDACLQEAIETLVVRIVEEKAEGIVRAAVEPPDSGNFPESSEYLAVLDAYLSMLQPARDVVREFVDTLLAELPVNAAAQTSLEGLFSVLQVLHGTTVLGWLPLAHNHHSYMHASTART
jgi:hypothetical protein